MPLPDSRKAASESGTLAVRKERPSSPTNPRPISESGRAGLGTTPLFRRVPTKKPALLPPCTTGSIRIRSSLDMKLVQNRGGDVEQIKITRRGADTHQDARADSASHSSARFAGAPRASARDLVSGLFHFTGLSSSQPLDAGSLVRLLLQFLQLPLGLGAVGPGALSNQQRCVGPLSAFNRSSRALALWGR